MNEYKIDLSKRKNLNALYSTQTKIIVLEGSSGSGKTWDSLYYLLWICQQNENKGLNIMIGRKSYSWIKDSVLRDFLKILKAHDIYSEKNFMKSPPVEYNLYGNFIHFRGADDPSRFQGPRWDIVYLNEASEMLYEECTQIFMRTNFKIIIDYNPKFTEHWIYDRIIPRPDCTFVHSTYKDNPELPENQRKEIEGYEPTEENKEKGTADPWRWKVFGLGERAAIEGVIFTNWEIIKPEDYPHEYKWIGIGVDFGFTNDPSVALEVCLAHGNLYIRELFYQKGMGTGDLAGQLKGFECDIIGDSSEPRLIDELQRLEVNIGKSIKGPDSVRTGIEKVKEYKLCVTSASENTIKELRNYLWKKDRKNDKFLSPPQPIDEFNHSMDALRYIVDHKTLNRDFYVI